MSDTLLAIADPSVGVVLGACGGLLIARRRTSLIGPLLLLACGCWFLGSVWGFALFLHRGPLVHVHISYPTGRIRRPLAIATVLCAYLVALVEAVAGNPWVTLGMAFLVALAATDIYARTSGPARKAGGPALAAALTFASVLALSAANQLLLWDNDRLVLLLYDLAISIVALLLTADLLWGRWTDATVADFVTQLGARADPGTLADAVRKALGDPTATIGFWLPDQQRYVDGRGAPFALPDDPAGRAVVAVDDDGQPAAVLVHDAAASHDPRLVNEVSQALRMALGNARLRARVQAGLIELSGARRRLVESADAQRTRLEAELAGGAGRRLEEVADLLEQAEAEAAEDVRDPVRAARAEVAEARLALRELAEGIRPAVLESGGLAAALPLLLRHARPVPVRLEVTPARLPPAIEGAVYFVCAEGLTNLAKHAGASGASVTVELERGSVVARVVDDGRGGADPAGSGLRGLRDRVDALGGSLVVADRAGGGTALEVRFPIPEEP